MNFLRDHACAPQAREHGFYVLNGSRPAAMLSARLSIRVIRVIHCRSAFWFHFFFLTTQHPTALRERLND
jgi:hypothetical protein